MARLNVGGMAHLKRQLSAKALDGAQAASEALREKLSGEGSGRHYSGLPNRSSREQEYPAEQTGQLRDSIAARQAGELRAEFGPVDNPPEYVGDLHFKPPDLGGRPFLDDAAQDRDIRRAITDAVGGTNGR